jgi:SAM-dependent methyltransferase
MTTAPDKTPAKISGMFDSIAPRYDLLNRTLSAGLDQRWRRRAVDALALGTGTRVIDLCAGTADVALAIAARHTEASVVGVDFSGAMLAIGLRKVRAAGLERRIRLVLGDAAEIPVASASCDGATIAFGIRNVAEPERALAFPLSPSPGRPLRFPSPERVFVPARVGRRVPTSCRVRPYHRTSRFCLGPSRPPDLRHRLPVRGNATVGSFSLLPFPFSLDRRRRITRLPRYT